MGFGKIRIEGQRVIQAVACFAGFFWAVGHEIGPAEIGMVERLIRPRSDGRFEFCQGFVEAFGLKELHGFAEGQLGAQGIHDGDFAVVQVLVVALALGRGAKDVSRLANGAAYGIEASAISRRQGGSLQGLLRKCFQFGEHGFLDLRRGALRRYAQDVVVRFAVNHQVLAQEALAHPFRRVDGGRRTTSAQSAGRRTDVESARDRFFGEPWIGRR